jgi:hypothetical protein
MQPRLKPARDLRLSTDTNQRSTNNPNYQQPRPLFAQMRPVTFFDVFPVLGQS